MKHIKLFEAWSSRFNRTLQGASALATSTNKGFGRAAKSVRDYAERQISEEDFTLELEDGRTVIFTHDPDFLLHPVAEFTEINPNHWRQQTNKYFKIPVKIKKSPFTGRLANELSSMERTGGPFLTFKTPDATSDNPVAKASILLGSLEGVQTPVRFSDRSGLENFLAMAMQAIITSPERGFSMGGGFEPSEIGMESFPEGMTAEKFRILNLFQDVVLKKDIREFIM